MRVSGKAEEMKRSKCCVLICVRQWETWAMTVDSNDCNNTCIHVYDTCIHVPYYLLLWFCYFIVPHLGAYLGYNSFAVKLFRLHPHPQMTHFVIIWMLKKGRLITFSHLLWISPNNNETTAALLPASNIRNPKHINSKLELLKYCVHCVGINPYYLFRYGLSQWISIRMVSIDCVNLQIEHYESGDVEIFFGLFIPRWNTLSE